MQTQNAKEVIELLATKLSVPAEQLWAVLVRQGRIAIVADLIIAAFLGVAWKFWHKWYAAKADEFDHEMPIAIVAIALGAFTIIAAVGLAIDVGYMLNPEYYAVSKILDALK